MVGMGYHPNVQNAEKIGRKYDILHEHSRFYDTSYSELEIVASERESEHGNATPTLEDRYHYHHGLKAGENTVAAHLVRVLMRSVAEKGRYDEQAFLDAFVDFLTTPGSRRDPYTEIYLRRWFENYSAGQIPQACAEYQNKIWSIGSHGGMIRPMVLSMLAATDYLGLGFAIGHQNLTHRSENVSAALGITVPLLQDLINGKDPTASFEGRSANLRVPKVTGEQLFAMYREHKGPGNIPHRQMWELHTDLSSDEFDLGALVADSSVEDVVLKKFGTACYPEHGLPLILFLAAKQEFEVEAALLANANAGGDNVHRGAVLGLLVGAASETFPQHLRDGLQDSESIGNEIDAFVDVATNGDVW